MSVMWEVLAFIVAVGVLVTVHEFGHFWVARRLGFKVLRFSVGFGKPLWKRIGKVDGTEYVIAAIPLGGYVKMLDEREGPVEPADLPRAFTRKPHWQRIAVLLAGAAFNFLFAILVLWGMFWVQGITQARAVVGAVTPGSPPARAGLRANDLILSIDDRPIGGQQDVLFGLLDAMSSDGEVRLEVRGNESGGAREATLAVSDPNERRKLTEPALLFTGLGFQFWRPVVLGEVKPEGPAGRAGLKPGDEVLAVGGTAVSSPAEVARLLGDAAGQETAVRYKRAGREQVISITPTAATVDGKTVGRIGVSIGTGPYPASMLTHIDLSPLAALGHATVETWAMMALQARLVWRMVTGNVSLKNISGPVSIAEFAGESAQQGLVPFLGFLVIISLSLAFMNLLPIPMLDGGQILFQLIEWVKGSPLSERAQLLGLRVGIGLILMLMCLAFYNDVMARFFNN